MKAVSKIKIAALLITLFALSCSSNGPVSQDPCAGYKYVKPEIMVYELLSSSTHPHIKPQLSDSLLNSVTVEIRSSKKSDIYQWEFSTDTRIWTGSVISGRFSKSLQGSMYIRLISFTSKDTVCGVGTGWDTVLKAMFLVDDKYPHDYKLPLHGTYLGTSTLAPNESYNVTLGYATTMRILGYLQIENLINGCVIPPRPEIGYWPSIMQGWRSFISSPDTSSYDFAGGCKNIRCDGSLSLNSDTLTIDYSFMEWEPGTPLPRHRDRIYARFVGVRQ